MFILVSPSVECKAVGFYLKATLTDLTDSTGFRLQELQREQDGNRAAMDAKPEDESPVSKRERICTFRRSSVYD